MKVLITGARGFTAFYLQQHLQKNPKLTLFSIDLADCNLTHYAEIETLLSQIQPDQIYHLAGSFTDNYDTDYLNNVVTTKNIFNALLKLKLNLNCRILLIGSAAEYGIPKTNPVNEEHSLEPVSMYGLTKVFQTHLMKIYCSSYSLNTVMARTFNLLGRGCSQRLFVGNLYEQIDLLKKGMIPKIVVGDLSASRDYIGIEKAVAHYETIMNRGLQGAIYNVGSGQPVRMSDILSKLLSESNLQRDIVEIKGERKSAVAEIYADIGKLMSL